MRATETRPCWFMAELVENATTNKQSAANATTKTQPPAKSAGRRRIKAPYSSSSILKNKKAIKTKRKKYAFKRISCRCSSTSVDTAESKSKVYRMLDKAEQYEPAEPVAQPAVADKPPERV